MKKIFTVCLVFLSLTIFAQKNVIKLNLPSLGFRNVYVSYERNLTEKMSVTLDLGILIPRSAPTYFESGSDETLNSGGSSSVDDDAFSSLKLTGINITPSVRFYTSSEKEGPRGFYVEPYLRYRNYTLKSEFKDNGYDAEWKGSWSKFGGGVAIGTQWLIADKFSVDVTWLGLDFAAHTFKLEASTTDPNANYAITQSDLQSELSELEEYVSMVYSSDNNSASAKGRFALPGLRFKVAVGYAF